MVYRVSCENFVPNMVEDNSACHLIGQEYSSLQVVDPVSLSAAGL